MYTLYVIITRFFVKQATYMRGVIHAWGQVTQCTSIFLSRSGAIGNGTHTDKKAKGVRRGLIETPAGLALPTTGFATEVVLLARISRKRY